MLARMWVTFHPPAVNRHGMPPKSARGATSKGRHVCALADTILAEPPT